MSRADRAQHRILALDGGGVRGVISVEVLRRLEAVIRESTGRPDLRLADWFDFIAGTSIGGILAALLATGHTADEVAQFVHEDARSLFRRARLRDRVRHRYDAAHLAERLRSVLGADTRLGSERIRTLLLLVLRNATTDSPWFISNNPRAKFNDRSFSGCNLDLPLWQLVRASTAAPTYFQPEIITIGGETFVFSDGGLTGYNNPAFKAFLLATAEPYGLSWASDVDRLLVVSIGAGTRGIADARLDPRGMHLFYQARTLPHALLSAASYQQDLLCRVFGECLVGEPLDLEVGDLIGTRGPAEPKLFTYVRYDVPLTTAGLAAIGCGHLDARQMQELDDVTDIPALQEIGAALAESRVRREHVARFLPGT